MSARPVSDSTPAARVSRVLRRPLDRFLQLEAASSVLLVAATVIALTWANSPWSAAYARLWQTPLSVGFGAHVIAISIDHVINDVLMAVFFFGAGLELRRELTTGALSDRRRATLPIIAAVGGMLVPALLYLLVNRGRLAVGWGVPMATDIAFAIGILMLLGPRVPPSMRAFLLALAIIDDVGAILVIAIFYSTGVELDGLGLAALGIAAVIGLQRLGTARTLAYAIPAAAIWLGLYRTGVHPTVAGVVLGLMTSARPCPVQGRAISPVERLERVVHPWVSFGIMPLFALANAGVKIDSDALLSQPALVLGISVGLVVGKPLGIVGASMLAVRLRLASLPAGLTWRAVSIAGLVAGIGFTMALFMTDLAIPTELRLVAKMAVLLSSTVAALGTVAVGRSVLARRTPPSGHRGRLDPRTPAPVGLERPLS